MQQPAGLSVNLDVAAETGIHLGDGSLFIRRGRPKTSYRYDVTGHVLEDQLYLLGCVVPTVSLAYGLGEPGIYVDREISWMSLRYGSKAVALFKHETLGLPNGKKTTASIPRMIRENSYLMRFLTREVLATDGILGYYSASNYRHKYPRIIIKLTARRVIEELAEFLHNELGMSVSLRLNIVDKDSWGTCPRHALQIACSEDIDTWRKEIGFSNPSQISRIMVFERLGECPPRTSIIDRLSFLSGLSSKTTSSGPIPLEAFISTVQLMRKSFEFPRLEGKEIASYVFRTNRRLQSRLGRRLPQIIDLRAAGEIFAPDI